MWVVGGEAGGGGERWNHSRSSTTLNTPCLHLQHSSTLSLSPSTCSGNFFTATTTTTTTITTKEILLFHRPLPPNLTSLPFLFHYTFYSTPYPNCSTQLNPLIWLLSTSPSPFHSLSSAPPDFATPTYFASLPSFFLHFQFSLPCSTSPSEIH